MNQSVHKLTLEERAGLKWWAQKHVDNGAYCLKHQINFGAPLAGGIKVAKRTGEL